MDTSSLALPLHRVVVSVGIVTTERQPGNKG